MCPTKVRVQWGICRVDSLTLVIPVYLPLRYFLWGILICIIILISFCMRVSLEALHGEQQAVPSPHSLMLALAEAALHCPDTSRITTDGVVTGQM